MHARECVLGYLLSRDKITGEQRGQPDEGTVVPVVELGQRLVSIPPVPAVTGPLARGPGHAGTSC